MNIISMSSGPKLRMALRQGGSTGSGDGWRSRSASRCTVKKISLSKKTRHVSALLRSKSWKYKFYWPDFYPNGLKPVYQLICRPSPAITAATRRAIEEVACEKTTYPHTDGIGPRLHSYLYNSDRSLGHISRSKVTNPRASKSSIRRRTLSRRRSAASGRRQVDSQRVLRSKNPEIDRESAEEGNRLGD